MFGADIPFFVLAVVLAVVLGRFIKCCRIAVWRWRVFGGAIFCEWDSGGEHEQ
jgi:hypothetical protein